DTRAPEVLEVSLATDNDNSSWGQASDQLTMTIRTSEPVRNLDVTDLALSSGLEGISVSKTDDDGMEWEAVATVGSSASGLVTFSLQVTDRAGNLGNLVNQTTDQSLVELDTSPPEIQNLTLVSDNSEDTLIQAREDDNITLRFDSLEKLQVPQITLSGHPLEVVDISSGAGTSWKAVYQVQPGDSGEVSFTIDYKDQASNEGIQKTGDDLSNKMVIDTQLPTVLTTGISIQSSNTIAAVGGLKWARKDENIKLIFNTSEHVFSPKVSIAGVEVNAFPRDSDTTGTQWEATYRVENILGNMLQSTNLVLRLDASNIDGNRNRGFSEGDQISNWMDLSSKGYTLNRSHNLRPTFSSTGMNGKPAVQFNGNSNLYVENFTSLSTDDYTILAVSQLASASGHQDLLAITKSDHGLLL
ncbi:MAG: hypothetical protein QF675_11735, partial [SAR324 cluster bacterium]|nr:hypothetical protein [SAR324 cluster bacterium]